MTRSDFLARFAVLGAAPFLAAACRASDGAATPAAAAADDDLPAWARRLPRTDPSIRPLAKPAAAWEGQVSDAAFRVLFEDGTERAGSSPLNAEKRPGTFVCAACALPLFETRAKFESGTGWPSFFRPIGGNVAFEIDRTLGAVRVEYHCARCGGHQGHVFPDAPSTPTGLRYCNNGVALAFVPAGTPLPALRS